MGFITVLLGSSVGAAIVTALFQWLTAKRHSETTHLQDQLRRLYGPLYYLTSQNQAFFDLYDKYHKAYNEEYVQKEYAASAEKQVEEEAQITLDVANSYIHHVILNNEKIMKILEKNWYLIDPDDVEIFAQFEVDYTRRKTELEGEKKPPLRIYRHLKEVSFMRPEMIGRVTSKWQKKKSRVEKLTS